MTTSPSDTNIQSLQVFRGVAAVAVVAHHANLSTSAFVGVVPSWASNLLNLGLLGVDFFFVLSGFIIAYAHLGDPSTWRAAGKYCVKRLARVYLPYLPIGIGMLVLYAAMPNLSAAGDRQFSIVSSVLLVPSSAPPALSVAWTLVHEVMFYAVFALVFVSVRWLMVGLVIWTGLVVLATLAAPPSGWLRYPLSFLNIDFVLGVGAALLVRRRIAVVGFVWIGCIGVGLVLAALALILRTEASPMPRLLLAAGVALFTLASVARERAASTRWPEILLLLGNASYSIYLVHNPLLSLTQRLAGHLGMIWPSAIAFGITVSLLAGLCYFWIVERPAQRYVRNALSAW